MVSRIRVELAIPVEMRQDGSYIVSPDYHFKLRLV